MQEGFLGEEVIEPLEGEVLLLEQRLGKYFLKKPSNAHKLSNLATVITIEWGVRILEIVYINELGPPKKHYVIYLSNPEIIFFEEKLTYLSKKDLSKI